MKKLLLFLAFTGITLTNLGQIYLNPDSSVDARVEDLLSRMTLEEKTGQMTQAERGSIVSSDFNDVKDYFLGSVLSGGGSAPSPNTPEAWVQLFNNIQERALSTRLGIPVLYGIDAVHGHNNLMDAVIFPHNIGLGCTRNPKLVKECARITALEVKASSLNWTFSPCVAVPQNEFWGRTYEGFGESPSLVDSLGKATILGYQNNSLGDEHSVLACAKHFVGDGGTKYGIDQGNTLVSENILRDIHLAPYYGAIEAGVGTIMASFSSWNGSKCHGNHFLLTELLKNEMDFNGFIISDWEGVDQLDSDFKAAIKKAINAGIDMSMQPNNYIEFINHLKTLVSEGQVSESRIDDAVRRILRIKFQMGLFENPMADLNLIDTVGSATHREVARQAVRESLVLLKNDGILPLPKDAGNILIAGAKSTDIGAQCGGWSISWQGQLGNITEGTSIYGGVKNIIGPGNILYTEDPNNIPNANHAIVVVGEPPYAEGSGDIYNSNDQSFQLSVQDKNMIQAIKESGIPMVVVMLSGRPLDIREELEKSDAFIAAWLPGTEGGSGIADVLFGDYKPTGKLSHTWPVSKNSVPLNIHVSPGEEEILFPYGFGLTYDETTDIHQNTSSVTLKVYPNPASTYLYIKMNQVLEGNVSILNITGQTLQKTPVKGKKLLRISLDQFPQGMYIVQVQNKDQLITQSLFNIAYN